MAVFIYTWNSAFTALPADTEDRSLGANRIRGTKQAVGERFAINHSLNGDGNDGKHTYIEFLTQGAYPNLDPGDGSVFTFQVPGAGVELYYKDANSNVTQLTYQGSVNVQPTLPSGTRMCFLQSAVPAGWVHDTSLNDCVIRINSGSGGGTGGAWGITGVTISGTALTLAQTPAHTHTLAGVPGGAAGSGAAFAGSSSGYVSITGITSSQGGGQSHTHAFSQDGSWRPAYVDAVVGVKS